MTVTIHGTNGITFPDATVLNTATTTVNSYRTTETSDVALGTAASGGTQVGSDISVTIPTSGVIRVTLLQGVLDWPGTNTAYSLGINVNSTDYFLAGNSQDGAAIYFPLIGMNGASADAYLRAGYAVYNNGGYGGALIASFDISSLGISTGSQTLKVKMADEASTGAYSGAGTLNGATQTGVFQVEIIEV